MDDDIQRAYVAGLKMLARRELSEAQVRTRLARKQFESADIDDAVRRLQQERALDDRRAALACARTEARVHRRGRARVVRQIESMGIARDIARAAVNDVFAELDENALLEQALDTRLRRGMTLTEARDVVRLHRYLVAQGFDPARVLSLVQSRIRNHKSQITNHEQTD